MYSNTIPCPSGAAQLYPLLAEQLAALTRGVPHRTANLANAAALLYWALADVNWAGFYLWEKDRLVLGPFHGKPACIEIPAGRGVCGTAAAQDRILCVPDVHDFPGHIACDSASRSEAVVPLHDGTGRVAAVLDLDSPLPNRFSAADIDGLTLLVPVLEEVLGCRPNLPKGSASGLRGL